VYPDPLKKAKREHEGGNNRSLENPVLDSRRFRASEGEMARGKGSKVPKKELGTGKRDGTKRKGGH